MKDIHFYRTSAILAVATMPEYSNRDMLVKAAAAEELAHALYENSRNYRLSNNLPTGFGDAFKRYEGIIRDIMEHESYCTTGCQNLKRWRDEIMQKLAYEGSFDSNFNPVDADTNEQ